MRVAYDISLLAQQFVTACKTGLYRASEETLHSLGIRADVDLGVSGLCGRDPVAASVFARLYLSHLEDEGFEYRFIPLLRSRSGWGQIAGKIHRHSVSREIRMLPRWSLKSLSARGASRAASILSTFDVAPGSDIQRLDVFHSTYLAFPPRSLTGRLPRVITIYDLIPLIMPQLVRPGHARICQAIVDSIDINHDWVGAISEYSKEEFCDYTGMSPDRVQVTPLAAAAHFHPVMDAEEIADARRRYGIPKGDYLLSLANLEPRKNLSHLIRSFFRLCAAEPDRELSLVLVGSKGWMYEDLLAAASSDRLLSSRVIFTGHIPDSDLSTIYSGAAVFVYPSLYEGFGLPPLEAMQCGVPVITSNVTSLPEVVGSAAVMIDPTDSDALCDAILQVLSDTQLREVLRAKGLRRAQNFSWIRCADRTVGLYRTAVGHS